MKLRFLKKKDGTKILQFKDEGYSEYKDIPMVDELTPSEILMNAINKKSLLEGNREFNILMSESFAKKIYDGSSQNIYSTYNYKDLSSFYGYKTYITNMTSDFKFIKEIK